MKISVIIPSYNQGRFIRRTLDSVLAQRDVDVEVLVFDAGSRDGTLEVLESFGDRIQWLSEPDRGQTDAINKGLKVATGDIHCYLNSDDIFYPGALRTVVEAFQKNPASRVVYGDADHIDEHDAVIEPYYNEEWNYQRLLEICYICQPATFWRREITEEFGLFDDSLHYAMDYDYWLRVGSREPFLYLKGARLAGSRMYAGNKTTAFRLPVHEEILKVVRRKTATPYRWLRVFADFSARQENLTFSRRGYATKVAQLSEQYSIPLDGPMLAEIAGLYLTAEEDRWTFGRLNRAVQALRAGCRGLFSRASVRGAVVSAARLVKAEAGSLMGRGAKVKNTTGPRK